MHVGLRSKQWLLSHTHCLKHFESPPSFVRSNLVQLLLRVQKPLVGFGQSNLMFPRLTFQSHPDVLAVALLRRQRRLQSSHGAVVRTCCSRELLLRALLSRWMEKRGLEVWGINDMVKLSLSLIHI